MDPINVNLKVPAIEKLIDYAASGVGAIAGPLLAPWKASKEGKAKLIAAETDAKVRQIQAGAEVSTLKIIAEAQSEARAYLPTGSGVHGTSDITREDITQSIEFQGRKRLVNTRAVLEGAAKELEGKQVDDHEPDPDWTARFFDCVQDVSSDDLQKIWAKILAGEVETPGKTSLRTLSILRDMSQNDAKRFSELMKFRISNFILGTFAQQVTNKSLDMHFLSMENIGLAYPSLTAYPNIRLSKKGTYDREHYGNVLRIEGPSEIEINTMELDATVLTPSGIELAAFCIHEPNSEYLSCFARYLQKQKCSLKLAPIISKTPDRGLMCSSKKLRTL